MKNQKHRLPRGIIVPSITAFHNDESLDESGTGDHVNWLISNGVDGIVPAGSSGEFPALRMSEAKRVFDIAMAAAEGRVPVYPATGRYATRDTIELTRYAEKIGAAGVMVIVPYYMLPDRVTIMEHFRAVRSVTDLPIILYNNPATVGVELGHEDIITLFDEGVVNGVKSSQGGIEATLKLHVERKGLCSYYGHDGQPADALEGGADGWFSLFPNVFPRLAKALYETSGSERYAIWRRIAPVAGLVWGSETHPLAAVKAALRIQGRDVGIPRRPLLPPAADIRKELERLIEEAGAQ